MTASHRDLLAFYNTVPLLFDVVLALRLRGLQDFGIDARPPSLEDLGHRRLMRSKPSATTLWPSSRTARRWRSATSWSS